MRRFLRRLRRALWATLPGATNQAQWVHWAYSWASGNPKWLPAPWVKWWPPVEDRAILNEVARVEARATSGGQDGLWEVAFNAAFPPVEGDGRLGVLFVDASGVNGERVVDGYYTVNGHHGNGMFPWFPGLPYLHPAELPAVVEVVGEGCTMKVRPRRGGHVIECEAESVRPRRMWLPRIARGIPQDRLLSRLQCG